MLVQLTIALSAATAVLAQFSVEVLQAPTGRGLRHPVDRCEATGANFGSDVATFSFSQHAIGCGIYVSPEDACAPVTFNPEINGTSSCTNFFAIVPRGKCNFSEKAFHVQRSKPIALTAIIIYNEKGKLPVDMNGGKYSEQVNIPVLMVSYDCMLSIMHYHPASEGYLVQIKISPGYYDLFRYLIPFVVVVGFCFLVLLISLFLKAIRLCRERRRIARKRLSKRNLKKIPTKKYRKGDNPETCAICLEDFLENEKLRVLPCRHTYHTGCIDPWLTQNRKVCPMCKRRVGAKNSDSESSDDERSRRQQEQPSTSSAPPPPLPSEPLHVTQTDETTQSYDASPPEPSITSNVMVEVHRNSAMGGSREQLVDEDFLSDLDHLSDDEEAETSLSQSLKKKIKGLFNRSGNEPLRDDDQDFGRLNTGFQGSSHSVAEQHAAAEHLVPQQEDLYHHGAEAEYDSDVRPTTPAGNQENSACVPGYQFRDPFETHNEAPTSTTTPSGPATNEDQPKPAAS